MAPAGGAGTGVFFLDAAGTATAARSTYIINTPDRLIIRIPSLDPGTYTLQVRTYCTHAGTLLKELRTIEYGHPLTVAG
jgi:hypothetical protein